VSVLVLHSHALFTCTHMYNNSMEMSPSWEATSCVATQPFPSFYGTQRFITMFAGALYWSLSLARSMQFIPHNPISARSILILSTPLHLGLPNGLFPSGFPPISYLHSSLSLSLSLSPSNSCYMPFPSHPPWLDHSNYTWQRVQVMKLQIMQFSRISYHFSLWFQYSFQTPLVCVPLLMSGTKFYTHTEPQAKL
jgi:hypothetical protein